MYDVFAIVCTVVRWSLRACVSGRHHQTRAELGSMPTCTWVVRTVAGVVSGEWPETERGFWPLFGVLADVDSEAFGLVVAP